MPNQILVIKPYWHLGTWVFDDPATDLVQEPFVSGIPEMINDLGKRHSQRSTRFSITVFRRSIPRISTQAGVGSNGV
jgi:hypothetical protein